MTPAPILMTPAQQFALFFMPAVIVIALFLAVGLLSYRLKVSKKVIPIALILLYSLSVIPANAVAYGNPLDTSNIMLFCYYKEPTVWNLTQATLAFETFTNHGNYIDGTIRVGMLPNNSPYPVDEVNQVFYSVNCRVRADGWVMAWINIGEEYKFPYFTTPMPDYSSTLGCAINFVYWFGNKVFPGYDKLGMYDFSRPSATRLLVVGMRMDNAAGYGLQKDIYAMVPATFTVIDSCITWYGFGKGDAGGTSYVNFESAVTIVDFKWSDAADFAKGVVDFGALPSGTSYRWYGEQAGDSDNLCVFFGYFMEWVL